MIDEEEYTFGVSGKLIKNVLVMYDRQTGTLWSQLIGEAIEGELEGTKLEFMPSIQTTWSAWKKQYPDTVALRKGYFGASDPYDSYYLSNRAGVLGESTRDTRLPRKGFVIGVELNNEAVAFPASVLKKEPVVNYEIGGEAILIVFDTETGAGAAFKREINDQTLSFSQIDGTTITDIETKTVWDGLSGEAIEGSLIGQRLTPIKSTSSF
ncbi:MAG: DUF3179 domain-containing protein [Anaerolineae bacterium]|jgi:hypothetical protein|nr:DUF3179 domain-containing protein [Anaerolineae bacterium]MBT3713750.1 DUF3179 domain-containing protein [Anaerolineae bacterium]MBT4311436.1 DUF3179 domain-containing protein [Anaerolineae bacterium]MBT4459163.1 DUF3179 domain-containing protein [Anaerolineae bacterium]MBT4841472.1 DUF3179 domain-containing protein [Anaerolineae bacterium]